MNLNATLLGQMITFLIFVWFTMKYVWPPLMSTMKERQKTIADGLAAAEKAEHDLELAGIKADEQMQEAKLSASKLLEAAQQRANGIVEEAREKARAEGERLMALAQEDIQQAYHDVRAELMTEVTGLAVEGASRILAKPLDKQDHDRLLNDLISEV